MHLSQCKALADSPLDLNEVWTAGLEGLNGTFQRSTSLLQISDDCRCLCCLLLPLSPCFRHLSCQGVDFFDQLCKLRFFCSQVCCIFCDCGRFLLDCGFSLLDSV